MIVGSSLSYFPLLQVLVLQQSIQRIQAKRQRYRGQTYKCNVSNPNNTTGGAVGVALTGRRGIKASGLGGGGCARGSKGRNSGTPGPSAWVWKSGRWCRSIDLCLRVGGGGLCDGAAMLVVEGGRGDVHRWILARPLRKPPLGQSSADRGLVTRELTF